MKNMFVVFASLMIGWSVVFSGDTRAADASKIRIGVEGAYPPFSQIGTDGKLQGFDIDIANALCAELKAQCTLVQQDFDGMIPGLLSRKIDAVIASMTITEERKRSVDFSDKYYQTPARMVAKAGSNLVVTPEGLKGKRIGVQRTTIHDRFATAEFKQSEIVRYTKQDDVFLDLASGRLDGALVDSIAAAVGFLKTPAGKGFAFVGPVYDDPKYFGIGAGIAVRKADTDLRNRLSAAITAIRANGVYKKIQDKYFDFDVYGTASSAGPK
ncbi:MAG: ABC transporter substrate-binding protein [Betaproteobacteria bacterium]|nr:ABC transporter substrate-binding protein [Betaproteobacteria bacterium]